MASSPLRPCRHPGCAALTRDGYCARHKRAAKKAGEGRRPWAWMYRTKAWRDDLRPKQLLAEPFCRACASQGVRQRATEVDHIRPHRGDWLLFTDRANLQSLCHSCHSAKTMRELNEGLQER